MNRGSSESPNYNLLGQLKATYTRIRLPEHTKDIFFVFVLRVVSLNLTPQSEAKAWITMDF